MDDKVQTESPVLLVDDEAEYLQSASFSLRSSGIPNVIKCRDSRKVMDLLAEQSPCVIVLDNLMPYINGVDLLPQIVSSYSHIPVIMLTAINEIDTAVGCMKQGAFDYLVKPVEKTRLVTSVKRAMEFGRMRRTNLDLTASLQKVNAELEEKTQHQEQLLEKLSRRSNQLKSILDTSPGAILLVRANGEILESNRGVHSYFGVDPDSVNGKSFDAFVSRVQGCFDDAEKFRAAVKEKTAGTGTREQLRSLDFDTTLKIEKPAKRIISLQALPVDESGGNDMGLVWAFADITELIKADEQLHTIVDASPIPLLISTVEDGRIIYANENLGRLAGYTRKEMEGKTTSDFYYDPKERKQLIERLQKDGFVRNRELKLKVRDGQFVWTVISLVLSKLGDENVIVGGLYDISAQKEALHKAEEARQHLLEAQSQLVQSEKMASLGGLVAGVAHEINNPVGAVNSSSDAAGRGLEKMTRLIREAVSLKDVKENPGFEKILKVVNDSHRVIIDGSSRIAEIVRSLKNFSRIDEAEHMKADIHEGLDSTLTLVHHQFKNRVEVVKKYGDIPLVNCYPNQLNQVFMNLLVNAGQAVEQKGTVTIQTSADTKNIYIRISDNGKGIPENDVSKVFDPGFTTKGVGVGTGLGLSISYNIIKKHCGRIDVESRLGKGTAFIITLPL